MRAGYPLRFYASPIKLLLLILLGSAFFALGYWLLFHHASRWDISDDVIDYGVMGFGAICLAVFALIFIYLIVLRHPLLEIDEKGWRGRPYILSRKQAIGWQEIREVAVHRQALAHGIRNYYLIVQVKDPKRLPRSRLRALNAQFYHSLARAGMLIQLNFFFVRTTPAEIDRMLAHIAQTCASDVRQYGVRLHRDILDF